MWSEVCNIIKLSGSNSLALSLQTIAKHRFDKHLRKSGDKAIRRILNKALKVAKKGLYEMAVDIPQNGDGVYEYIIDILKSEGFVVEERRVCVFDEYGAYLMPKTFLSWKGEE